MEIFRNKHIHITDNFLFITDDFLKVIINDAIDITDVLSVETDLVISIPLVNNIVATFKIEFNFHYKNEWVLNPIELTDYYHMAPFVCQSILYKKIIDIYECSKLSRYEKILDIYNS